MRRALSAIALTSIGLAALATFHSASPLGRGAAHAATAPLTRRPVATAPTTPKATTPPATAPPAAAPPANTAPANTAPPATTAPASKSGTFDGDPFDNQYGTVQVRITVQGGKITAVDELQMPSDRQRSAYISQQAGPYLQQEALQAQSANIDLVSGATYTSDSYAQSLQSAIDRAHL